LPPPVPPVVLNNTPLVALWSIKRWELLNQLFDEIYIPLAVEAEFLATETESRRKDLSQANWIQVTAVDNPRHARSFIGLDQGEAETLALAVELDARLVIIDEVKGRKFAQRLGLPLTGTMGVLLLAKENGLVEKIAPLIEQLQEVGFYITPELVTAVLSMADE
jgi:predicted nucleic acid-binding protein